MNERIDAARQELQRRIVECDEARRAVCAASTKAAKSLARENFEGRSLAVDQAAAHLAPLLAIDKARAVIPACQISSFAANYIET
jgi:hypothetical protein